MKLLLKTPIVIEEKHLLIFTKKIEYPYAHISLSMTTGFSDAESYTLAMRIVPYRITEEGQIEKLESHQQSISSLNGLSDNIAGTLTKDLVSAIQKHLTGE
jgi:hypothetical protein